MPLMHMFEVLLLIAIVAGIFVGWKEPIKYENETRRADAAPADQQAAIQ